MDTAELWCNTSRLVIELVVFRSMLPLPCCWLHWPLLAGLVFTSHQHSGPHHVQPKDNPQCPTSLYSVPRTSGESSHSCPLANFLQLAPQVPSVKSPLTQATSRQDPFYGHKRTSRLLYAWFITHLSPCPEYPPSSSNPTTMHAASNQPHYHHIWRLWWPFQDTSFTSFHLAKWMHKPMHLLWWLRPLYWTLWPSPVLITWDIQHSSSCQPLQVQWPHYGLLL